MTCNGYRHGRFEKVGVMLEGVSTPACATGGGCPLVSASMTVGVAAPPDPAKDSHLFVHFLESGDDCVNILNKVLPWRVRGYGASWK